MRCCPIGQKKPCQSVGERVSNLITHFHGTLKGEYKVFCLPIGGWMVRSTADVSDDILLDKQYKHVRNKLWPLSKNICSGILKTCHREL